MDQARPPLLEARGITKRFPGALANDAVDFSLRAGEIHALLGENGAGKTTLMNVFAGLVEPDAGEVWIEGEPVAIHTPGQARALGIGMVHQHFLLIPVFTVAENVVLGAEPTRAAGVLDRAAARDRLRALAAAHGLAVDPDELVEDLPVGVQQRVEILRRCTARRGSSSWTSPPPSSRPRRRPTCSPCCGGSRHAVLA
jgi:simple sugar transport system ATP-binding protein